VLIFAKRLCRNRGMSGAVNLFKKITGNKAFRAVTDPAAFALNSAAPTNSLVKFLTPGQTTGRRLGEGDELNTSSVGDPANFFTQSKLEKDRIAAQNAAALAAAPKAPNQDTAANSAQQQSDYLRRRRGVLANIFGGNQPNSAPVTTSSKSLLGS